MTHNIHRLLTEARKLIATMDPQPGHPLDGVDELVHAALTEMEKERRVSDPVEWNQVLAAVRGCKDYLGGWSGTHLEAFHHGMTTVEYVLTSLREDGETLQNRMVLAVGQEQTG